MIASFCYLCSSHVLGNIRTSTKGGHSRSLLCIMHKLKMFPGIDYNSIALICFRIEEVGFIVPTDVQQQALPVLLSGRDCILHAQVNLWS